MVDRKKITLPVLRNRKKNNKISFWEWSKKIYNPEELKISFKINFVNVLLDSLMRRE